MEQNIYPIEYIELVCLGCDIITTKTTNCAKMQYGLSRINKPSINNSLYKNLLDNIKYTDNLHDLHSYDKLYHDIILFYDYETYKKNNNKHNDTLITFASTKSINELCESLKQLNYNIMFKHRFTIGNYSHNCEEYSILYKINNKNNNICLKNIYNNHTYDIQFGNSYSNIKKTKKMINLNNYIKVISKSLIFNSCYSGSKYGFPIVKPIVTNDDSIEQSFNNLSINYPIIFINKFYKSIVKNTTIIKNNIKYTYFMIGDNLTYYQYKKLFHLYQYINILLNLDNNQNDFINVIPYELIIIIYYSIMQFGMN